MTPMTPITVTLTDLARYHRLRASLANGGDEIQDESKQFHMAAAELLEKVAAKLGLDNP